MRKFISLAAAFMLAASLCTSVMAEADPAGSEATDSVAGLPKILEGLQGNEANVSAGAVSGLMQGLDEGQGAAADESIEMRIVSCPEQGFSTLAESRFFFSYDPEQGMSIYTGGGEGIPFVLIFKTEGTGFDPENYFNNVFTPQMQSGYGSNLTEIGQYQTYTVAGTEMPGVMYTYLVNDIPVVLLRVFDIRDDHFVCYTAKCRQDDTDDTFGALARAAYYYQPDPDYYQYEQPQDPTPPQTQDPAPPESGKQIISCPEMNFSVLTEPGYIWTWDESSGISIYTETEGNIPFVLVYKCSDLFDGREYLEETHIPHMQEKYGSDLIGITEYETYSVGGKELPAVLYIYRVGDYVVNMLRLVDTVDGHSVLYTAKYLQGDDAATLAALDLAVSSYQPDAAYYGG